MSINDNLARKCEKVQKCLMELSRAYDDFFTSVAAVSNGSVPKPITTSLEIEEIQTFLPRKRKLLTRVKSASTFMLFLVLSFQDFDLESFFLDQQREILKGTTNSPYELNEKIKKMWDSLPHDKKVVRCCIFIYSP